MNINMNVHLCWYIWAYNAFELHDYVQCYEDTIGVKLCYTNQIYYFYYHYYYYSNGSFTLLKSFSGLYPVSMAHRRVDLRSMPPISPDLASDSSAVCPASAAHIQTLLCTGTKVILYRSTPLHHSQAIRIMTLKGAIRDFLNLLTAPWTVSNVGSVQSCANHEQYIGRLSCATYRATPRGTKGQLTYWVWQRWDCIHSIFKSLAETINWWRRGGNRGFPTRMAYLCTRIYSRDIPFWSGTLKIKVPRKKKNWQA